MRELELTDNTTICVSDSIGENLNWYDINDLKSYAQYVENPEEDFPNRVYFENNKAFGTAHLKDGTDKLFYVGTYEEGKEDLKNLDIVSYEFDQQVESYSTHFVSDKPDFETGVTPTVRKEECWKPYDIKAEIRENGAEVATWKQKVWEALPDYNLTVLSADNYRNVITDIRDSVDAVKDVSEIFNMEDYFEKKGFIWKFDDTVYEGKALLGTGITVPNVPTDKESLAIIASENGYTATMHDKLLDKVKEIIPDFFNKNQKTDNQTTSKKMKM